MRQVASIVTLILFTATRPAGGGPQRSPSGTGPPPPSEAVAPLAAEGPLTLPEAVVLARQRSAQRASAAALAQGAREAVPFSARWPNPLIEVRSENWTLGSDAGAELQTDTFVVLSQPIELAGKRGARRALASADAALGEQLLVDVERQVATLAAQRYVEAVRARELALLLAEQRTSSADLVHVMQRRVDEGYAPESDLRKFEAELSRVDTQLLRARLELDRSVSALGVLIGELTVDSARLVEPSLPAPRAGDFTEVARSALEHRPEVAAARARVERARSQLSLEHARRTPDLAVVGGYKRTVGTGTGVLGVIWPIPLFDRNRLAVVRAEAEVRAAELDLDLVRRTVQSETETALRTALALHERAGRVERDSLQPAEVVRNAARSAFREGGGDILRLVDAERVYLDARRDALELKLDAALAGVRARLALGEEIVR